MCVRARRCRERAGPSGYASPGPLRGGRDLNWRGGVGLESVRVLSPRQRLCLPSRGLNWGIGAGSLPLPAIDAGAQPIRRGPYHSSIHPPGFIGDPLGVCRQLAGGLSVWSGDKQEKECYPSLTAGTRGLKFCHVGGGHVGGQHASTASALRASSIRPQSMRGSRRWRCLPGAALAVRHRARPADAWSALAGRRRRVHDSAARWVGIQPHDRACGPSRPAGRRLVRHGGGRAGRSGA